MKAFITFLAGILIATCSLAADEPSRFSYQWWLNWFYKFIDDPISLFTFVLAISTILLWLDTRGLRKIGIEEARGNKEALVVATIAANAAKKAAEVAESALLNVERPYILVTVSDFSIGTNSVDSNGNLFHPVVTVIPPIKSSLQK